MKKQLLFLTFISSISFAQDEPVFDAMFDRLGSHVARIQEEFETMVSDMFNDFGRHTSNINTFNVTMPSITQDDNTVSISMKVSDLDTEKIEIKRMPKEDYLLVTFPEKNNSFEMTITPYDVAYTSKKEQKQEKKEDDKPSSVYYSYGSSMMRQSLPSKVNLDEVHAEYENNILTIRLQKMDPSKNVQIIPIVKK